MLDFLINTASAAAQPAVGQHAGPGLPELLLVVVFVVLFLFLIRTQNKRQKDQQTMQASLQKGDEVVTIGGFLGKIVKLSDDFIVLNIAENLDIKIQKSSISGVLPKGTIKAID